MGTRHATWQYSTGHSSFQNSRYDSFWTSPPLAPSPSGGVYFCSDTCAPSPSWYNHMSSMSACPCLQARSMAKLSTLLPAIRPIRHRPVARVLSTPLLFLRSSAWWRSHNPVSNHRISAILRTLETTMLQRRDHTNLEMGENTKEQYNINQNTVQRKGILRPPNSRNKLDTRQIKMKPPIYIFHTPLR